jgi:hypothetical protein
LASTTRELPCHLAWSPPQETLELFCWCPSELSQCLLKLAEAKIVGLSWKEGKLRKSPDLCFESINSIAMSLI